MKQTIIKFLTKYLKWGAFALCVALLLVLEIYSRSLVSALYDQNIAKYWDSEDGYVQMSVFLSDYAGFGGDKDDYLHLRYEIMNELKASGVEVKENSKGLTAIAFSGKEQVVAYNGTDSVKASAFGVYGDYFTFHPMQLISGSFFDNDTDINGDGVVLDENTAWQLFGATYIEGKYITIGDRTFVVRGVVKSEDGMFSDKIMDTTCNIYMSMEALKSALSIEDYAVNAIEVLMPNPVNDFGFSTLDKIMSSALSINTAYYEIKQNTGRYDVKSRINLLKSYSTSTMNVKALLYPYWENRAKGYEQIVLMIFLLQIMLSIYPLVIIIIEFRRFLKWVEEWYWTLKYNIRDFIEDKLHL